MFKIMLLCLIPFQLLLPQNDVPVITVDRTAFPIPVNREDVKSIGMGKTGVAMGYTFNAMTYNPALLGHKKFSLDAFSLQASLPPQTFTAAGYLNDHRTEFRDALSLKQIWNGVDEFKAAGDVQAQLAALEKIQEGLRFPVELLDDVIGDSKNPTNHGVRVLPSVSMQLDNWGFSIWGLGQSNFIVEQSPIIEALLQIDLPDNLNNQQEVMDAVLSMEALLNAATNGDPNKLVELYPVILSASYIDVVGAAGYGRQLFDNFYAGANIKVVHRRFSAKRIVASDLDNVLNVLKRDLDGYVTGVTMDLGALYRFSIGTEVGLTVQNIIPVKKVSSNLDIDLTLTGEQNGQVVVQPVKVILPFDLELPVILSAGASHRIFPEWTVALDWYDIAEQDIRFEDYVDRFRLGTEYRLEWVKDKIGAAFRLGLADSRPTFGIGFNLYRAVQIDGAYAYDAFIGENSYFAQIRFGW